MGDRDVNNSSEPENSRAMQPDPDRESTEPETSASGFRSHQAVMLLRGVLETGTVLDCVDAIARMERLGNDEAVAPLLTMRLHEHPGVRMAAAKTLGSFQTPEVVSGLLDWLRSETEVMVQTWIVMSLGRLGDVSTVPFLIEALRETSSSELRRIVIRALGTLGDPRAIDVILTYANDEDGHVRKDVAEALQKLRGKSGD